MALSLSGGGGGAVLPPAMPTSWSPAYGGKPQVPSPGASASSAIGSNIGNLGSLYSLGSSLNTFNTGQLNNDLAMGLPNYKALTQSASANIGNELSGNVPDDVINQILQRAAERGIATGTVGSDNNNAAYLRALGLTSLDMTALGERNLSSAVARTPVAKPFDPTSLFINPEQVQEAQMASNLYASAPDPRMAAGAALGAAHSGLNAGVNSIHAPPAAAFPTNWGSSTVHIPAGPGGTIMASAFPENIVDPAAAQNAAYTNWNSWMASLPTNVPAVNDGPNSSYPYPGYGGDEDYYG